MSRGIETAPWVVSWRRAMYRLCIAYAIVLFIHSGICDYGSIERPWGLFLSTSCSAVSHLHFGHPDSVQKQYIARAGVDPHWGSGGVATPPKILGSFEKNRQNKENRYNKIKFKNITKFLTIKFNLIAKNF